MKSIDFKIESYHKIYLKQGFLNSNKHRVVRIRIVDQIGYITPIEKIRYLIKSDNHIIEVDEFLGINLGLYVAEIELNSKEYF